MIESPIEFQSYPENLSMSLTDMIHTANRIIVKEFNSIVRHATLSESLVQLMKSLKVEDYQNFTFGSGSSHVWVNQNLKPDKRTLLITENRFE